jgi:hypothetical protein
MWQLVAVAVLMVLSHLCTGALGFTNGWVNLVFQHMYLVWPFLAIRPARRLSGGAKLVGWIVLAPLLAFSFLGLFFTVILDIPAVVEKVELSRDLSSVAQGSYSVVLLDQETAGGAVGPHGLSLEQRMFILPGVYVVKYVDYFEDGVEGSLLAEGTDKVRLHIPKRASHQEVDRVYSLKRRVYI